MAKNILDSDASENEADGVELNVGSEFKVNEEFAKRFTHNKKREELARLEDKHGNTSRKRKRDNTDGAYTESSEQGSSSESESEDDAGELATEALDTEIMDTLNAIRSKDPRVYDEKVTFYKSIKDGDDTPAAQRRGDKPVFLRDYHRENLLNGVVNGEDVNEDQPGSYNQEQERLKRSIVGEIKAAADVSSDDSDGEDGKDDFLVAKSRPKAKPKAPATELDVENADKDPEKFLSNFLTSRAWVPSTESNFQPFESDDEEEERRAEEFENAYNFRFEDPAKANEKLRSHARDMAAKYSVRREEKNSRQKARDAKKEKREAEKEELREEKARLRKLRIEELQEKVRKIKRAAGLKGKDLQPEDWSRFVDEDWDDAKWEEEMQKRFGADYYADDDAVSDEGDDQESTSKRKIKKPKWEDDIDIKDLVPDFVEEEEAQFSDSDQDDAKEDGMPSTTNHKKDRADKRKESKKERRIIEQLVDDELSTEPTLLKGSSKRRGFRYRETSPTTFGLSALDILLADDAQLNQFAGIKKLAAFRDPERKRKDRKYLGKKARLREWRKETFGHEDGLQGMQLVPEVRKEYEDVEMREEDEGGVDIRTTGKKKRRRNKKGKSGVAEAA